MVIVNYLYPKCLIVINVYIYIYCTNVQNYYNNYIITLLISNIIIFF